MGFECKVLADSVAPNGVRLTTLEATFPRFILAEVNTHRMLSRNSASSRAIPTEKIIARVLEDPFVPLQFNRRVRGMGVGEAFDSVKANEAERVWLDARDDAVAAAKRFVELDLDKSRVNRLLEPFMWHTAIITATEWDNFFGLRCHPDAQPEFRMIAEMMRDCIGTSKPRDVQFHEWHLPLIDLEAESFMDPQDPVTAFVSAGRCARVSFDRHGETEDPDASHERAERLMKSGHLSPFEHVASPLATRGFSGNFRGWHQLRKTIKNEDNFALVVKETA